MMSSKAHPSRGYHGGGDTPTDANQSALADKLDRLAKRLQQISNQSADYIDQQTADPRANFAPGPSGARFEEPHGFDETGFDRYTEAFDDGRCEAVPSTRRASPAPLGRSAQAPAYAVGARDQGQDHHQDHHGDHYQDQHWGPGPFQESGYRNAGSKDDRLAALVQGLDDLDQQIGRQHSPNQQNHNHQNPNQQGPYGRPRQGTRPNLGAEPPVGYGSYAQNRDQRSAHNHRDDHPTAADIGRAVEGMRDESYRNDLNPYNDHGAGPQAPSSKRIPRRRSYDWSPDARTGRRSTDRTFKEVRAELDALRSNLGAQTPSPGHNGRRQYDQHSAPRPAYEAGSHMPSHQQNLDHLEDISRQLSQSMAHLDPQSLNELRGEVREIRGLIQAHSPSRSLQSIETGIGETMQRLDRLTKSIEDPGASQRLERRVEELAHLLDAMPQLQHMNGLERRLDEMSARFDAVSAHLDPSGQAQMATGLRDIRSMMRGMDPEGLHHRIDGRLQELGAHIASVEAVARDARGYAADLYDTDRNGLNQLGERLFSELHSLRTQLADGDQGGNMRVLQSRIEVLTEKIELLETKRFSGLDHLDASLGSLAGELPQLQTIVASVQSLERQIDGLGQRLEGAGGSAGHLAPLEDRLSRLEDSARFIGEAVNNNTTEARLGHLSQQLADLSECLRSGNAETASMITRALQGLDLSSQGSIRPDELNELTQRLDDIQSLIGGSGHGEQMSQIQATLDKMVNTLGVDLRQDMLDRLEVQIGRLGDRVSGLTDIDTLTRMEATTRKLSSVLESSDRFDRLVEVEGRLSALADQFEQNAAPNNSQDLEQLRGEIAGIRAHLETPSESQLALERAMASLTERLDTQTGSSREAELIERLEQQMNAVAERFQSASSSMVDLAPLEQRLIDIEHQLSKPGTGQNGDAIELARIAARDAVREVAQEMAAQQESEPDPVIEELRAQIHALQEANEAGRAAHEATLQTVTGSLDEILTRLEGAPTTSPSRATAVEEPRAPIAVSPTPRDPEFTQLQADHQPPAVDPSTDHEPDLSEFAPIQPTGAGGYRSSLEAPAFEDQPGSAFGSTSDMAPAKGDLSDLGLKDPFEDTGRSFRTLSEDSFEQDDFETDAEPQSPVLSHDLSPEPEEPEAASTPMDEERPAFSPNGGLKRESVSDLRARLFGGPEGGEAIAEPLEPKRSSLRERLLKSKDTSHAPTEAKASSGLWGWKRKKDKEPEVTAAVEPEEASAPADFGPHSQTANEESVATKEPKTREPKLDLNQSTRPDANTLSSEFQPLTPGRRPGAEGPNAGDLSASERHEAAGYQADMEANAASATDASEDAGSKSLFGRMKGLMGRKSGTMAISAGAALLVAGSMHLHDQLDDSQLLALLGDQLGPTQASLAPGQQAPTASDEIASLVETTLANQSGGSTNLGGIDPVETGSAIGNLASRVPAARDLAPQVQPAYPGNADSFSLDNSSLGPSVDSFSKTPGFAGQDADPRTGAEHALPQAASLPLEGVMQGENAPGSPTASASTGIEIPGSAIAAQGLSASIAPGASVDLAVPREVSALETLGTPALRDAALSGNSDAEFQIGYMLLTGKGGQPEPEQALTWFEKSAAKDHAPSQFQMGLMYKHGRGVQRDPALALTWFKRAAANGNIMAMHALAVAYSEGVAGVPDYASAAKWFERAASFGVKDSQFNTGLIYARGLGVNQDLPTSYKWFALAAKQGDRDAGEKRDTIATKLNRQQLAAAKLAVDTWERSEPMMAANKVNIPQSWQEMAPDVAANSATKPADSGEIAAPSALLIQETQRLLTSQGYDTGGVDGQMGPKTSEAIRAFQRDVGMDETGNMSPSLLRQLLSLQS